MSGENPELFQFAPLSDPSRWDSLLLHHSAASVFHSLEWLEALRRTYSYEPVALTTCPPGAVLRNVAVFCRIETCISGRRLVSLPFSDHCAILADTQSDLAGLVAGLTAELHRHRLRYIELRPTSTLPASDLAPCSSSTYCHHRLDLTPDLSVLLGNCHRDSIQRKIRRAQRDGLAYEEGRSAALVNDFYRLLVATRRRHHVPPQPRQWFQSLVDSFGEALKIRVALRNRRAVAAILTLRYKDTLFYKYGCSDAQYHNLGGMQLLIWNSIRDARENGLRSFDLGRSDWNNPGLITFKDRWGCVRSVLTYVRLLPCERSRGAFPSAGSNWWREVAGEVLSHLPDAALESVGSWIYRHIG